MPQLVAKLRRLANKLRDANSVNELLNMPAAYREMTADVPHWSLGRCGPSGILSVSGLDIRMGSKTIIPLSKCLLDKSNIDRHIGRFMRPDRMVGAEVLIPIAPRRGLSERAMQEVLLRYMLYDYACLCNFALPYGVLVAKVGKGDHDALLKLVQVDKTFVMGAFGGGMVLRKQHEGAWSFFERLGVAIGKRPVDEPPDRFKAKLICAYLWESDFLGWPMRDIVEALREAGVMVEGSDEKVFAQALYRHGLQRAGQRR